jgi:hypothetical protein
VDHDVVGADEAQLQRQLLVRLISATRPSSSTMSGVDAFGPDASATGTQSQTDDQIERHALGAQLVALGGRACRCAFAMPQISAWAVKSGWRPASMAVDRMPDQIADQARAIPDRR